MLYPTKTTTLNGRYFFDFCTYRSIIKNFIKRGLQITMDLSSSGKRILYTRNLTCLTRNGFCKKYNIPIITLRSWEASIDIKIKAAARFATAIHKEGIYCDPAWIMSGVGRHPYILTHNTITETTHKNFSALFDKNIVKEIGLLKKTYKTIIHQLVVDDSMFPFLHPGDYIAGFYTTNPAEYIGCPCIIETVSGQNLVRIINEDKNEEENEDKKKYKLTTLNSASLHNLSLLKQEIKQIAKIFWIRKRR